MKYNEMNEKNKIALYMHIYLYIYIYIYTEQSGLTKFNVFVDSFRIYALFS